MTTMNIADAKAKLSELVARAEAGEEVVISRNGEPAARLTSIRRPNPTPGRRRAIGLWDHLGLELDGKLFFEPDLELEKAIEESRIFPPEK